MNRSYLVVLGALLALLGAGCASVPEQGPVTVAEAGDPSASAAPFDFNPPGPRTGASPDQVVAGFLSALQATPVTTRVAAQYLSADAAENWRPGRRTLVYESQSLSTGVGAVTVDLSGAYELDAVGRWQGAASRDGELRMRLPMVREDGEWRIGRAPDAMVIPTSHFQTRYRSFSLYFLETSSQVLVPEPVYLPAGVQAPTSLVSGLLEGPSSPQVERTGLPPGSLAGVGVPVTDGGVAQVPLGPEILDVPAEQLEHALAQLAWTLRQVPDIERFQITVDGVAMELPDGGSSVAVDAFPAYSPVVAGSSSDLFGVRGDRVIQLVGSTEITVAELPETTTVRGMGLSLSGRRVAVVDDSGTRVSVLDRDDDEPRFEQVLVGSDLLRPMWDLAGALWVVDRGGAGPQVVVRRDDRVRVLPVPASGGVVAAALSRDGTRLAWVGELPGGRQQLWLSRVVRRGNGMPVRLGPPAPVPTGSPWSGVRDLAWRDPVTVAALTRPTPGTSQVQLAAVDGSSELGALRSAPGLLFDRGLTMAASPGAPTALVVAARGARVHSLSSQGRWELDVVEAGLRHPAYVG